MLAIQKFLCENSLDLLTEKFAIKATRHPDYPNLVLFKYDMIDSPMTSEEVRDARGIILNENDNWSIVSFPFRKFFNHGEVHCAEIDWKNCKVQEKVDGSLMTIYVYDGQWQVATSGTPNAGGQVNGFDFSFEDLFWKTFDQYDIILPAEDCNACFFFELTSQYNKVVVRHGKPGLTLLGGRFLINNQEMTPAQALEFFKPWDQERRTGLRAAFDKLEAVKEFPLTSMEEVNVALSKIDPVKMEGFVLVGERDIDGSFKRQKCKSLSYVALHHLKDSVSSQKSIVQIVLNGEIDEVVNAFPEFADMLNEAKARLFDLIVELETAYEKIKDIPVQKDFALIACTTRCSSALFALRGKKVNSIREHLCNMNINSVMQLLNYKE